MTAVAVAALFCIGLHLIQRDQLPDDWYAPVGYLLAGSAVALAVWW